ncbi:MAG: glycoside hydrolase family 125 protein [Chthoniobacteraceae bacterium]|nr:glycoside hydrolase family 125 protein [Chthoniobacteraceae bacterium]
MRTPPSQRCFRSAAVDDAIAQIKPAIADPELASMFEACFPNTLDTTVTFSEEDGAPDTFVITGDIAAMWLRDSSAQVWPYLPLAKRDEALRKLLEGVIRRQTRCVLLDPYANAFYREPVLGQHREDITEMRPGVHERKWELDSLAYYLRLSHGYWKAAGDCRPFDGEWRKAVARLLEVLRVEQSGSAEGVSPYTFMRLCKNGDAMANGGNGDPRRRTGLVRCGYRPSDDLTKLPFLVPANAMMSTALSQTAELLAALDLPDLAAEAGKLAAEIAAALERHAIAEHPEHGKIWAYEVDGFGGQYLMDDPNVPSLLALPYLGFCAKDDPLYRRTRAFCLSRSNPYFIEGKAGRGIGSIHTGLRSIWPMSILMCALTSEEDAEILDCLRLLKATHAGTGFIHESFDKDDPARFSRSWFAWANTLFGELIMGLHATRPHLLQKR